MGFLNFQKVSLKWNEPAELVAARDRKIQANERWWLQPAILIVFVAIMMLIQYFRIHHPVPGKHPPGLWVSLLLFIVMGLFIGYGIPWINRRCPSQIRMRPTFLTITRGQRVSYIHYKNLQNYSWSLEQNVLVLILHRKNGWRTVVGVADQGVMHAVDQLLRDAAVTRLAEQIQHN